MASLQQALTDRKFFGSATLKYERSPPFPSPHTLSPIPSLHDGRSAFSYRICRRRCFSRYHALHRLVSYIDDVKDAKDKAEQITDEVDHFSDVLELLENVVSKASASPAISVTRTGVVTYSSTIEKVRERLEKSNSSNKSGVRECLIDIKRRVCFPFKKTEILYWKDVLRDVQQSLQTAHQILQSEQQHTNSEDIKRLLTQEAQLIHTEMQMMRLQEHNHLQDIRNQLLKQTQSMIINSKSSIQHVVSLQTSVGSIQHNLTPVIGSTAEALDKLDIVMSSIDRLGHRVNDLKLSSF
ncbi:hypothetical protein K458DRAFT_389750 [Lentithecium fluviatile CBS 122367]|uniref:Uncharacterized protein n=1 Tax=Lentithecium fluviatile CBS 122367 TaxID=1168545 RepID=A0A6G1J0B7_9PLEO|nr:hypothetical protein K458DRAFT_389750 [Lentithecium fluviatile CBS 122367]